MALDRRQALAMFAQQRGQSNVYGGPQLPAAPQPPPAPRPAGGAGSKFEEMLAAASQGKKQQQAQQAAQSITNGGNVLSQGLGTVLGGAGNALGFLGRTVVAGLDEFAESGMGEAIARSGAPGTGALMSVLNQRNDGESFGERIKDPTYGYGKATVDSGNAFVDNLTGFAGDVITDPLSYMGGAATKGATHTIGKAGRTHMASTLARAGFGDDVVGEAARRGVAYLDDAAREAAGVGKAGLYFGYGDTAARIPGTERLGKALEKGFANARVNTVGRITAPAGRKLRTVPELVEARRVLDAGREIDGVTPTMAAERIRFYDDVNRVMKSYTELKGRDVHDLLRGVDERAAVTMTHALEAGGKEADPFRLVMRTIFEELEEKGVKLGDLGPDYVPHRWTPEAIKFFNEDPRGRAIASLLKVDTTEAPTALRTRLIKGGEEIPLPGGGVFKVPASGTVKDINVEMLKQFNIKGLEDDIRKLLSGYINEAGRAMGLREAWNGLAASKSDIMQRLDAIGVEQLDELATVTANKEMKSLLEKTVEARGRKLGERAATAAELTEKLRKSVLADVERTVKGLGDDHKNLQAELKDLLKQVNQANTDEAAIVRDFQEMYSKASKEFDRVVKELQTASERVDALRGEQQLADSLRTDASRQLPSGGETVVSATVRQAEIAEARLADQMDLAVDALERLDDLGEQLFAASAEMRKWDSIADSPELLSEVAATRSVPEETTRFVPDLEPALGDVGSMRMKRMDALYDQAVGDEVGEFERASRAAARSQEIVEAKGRRIEVLKGRLERVSAQLAEEEQALRVAGEGWVPLEMRARRTRLLERMAKTSDELKEVVRKERLATNRQERLRAANQGRANEAAKFADADAELWEANARAVGEAPWSLATGGKARSFRADLEAAQRRPYIEQRYYELGTLKMELEQDLREIADDYVAELGEGTTRKPFAEARAAKEADLADVMAAIRQVDEEMVAAAESPNAARIAMIKQLNDYRDDTITELANSLQTKRWHERLSKIENQPSFVNSPETINAQRELVRKIERATDNYHVTKIVGEPGNKTLSGRLVTEVGERRAARTPVDIIEETTALRDQLDALPQVEPNPLLDRKPVRAPKGATQEEWNRIRGRVVSDEEAQVVADHMRSLSDELHKADAKAKAIENELATRFPSANQGAARYGGVDPKMEVTNDGVPLGSQTLTRGQYDELSTQATPTVGGRRAGAGNRGMQQVNEDELGGLDGQAAIDAFTDELQGGGGATGRGLADDTIDQADLIDQNVDAVAGDLPDGGFTRQALAYQEIVQSEAESNLRTALAEAQDLAKDVRKQYNNALRAYGLDDTAGDGFAYGRWGNILLVDLKPLNPSARRWSGKNTANAIAMTDKELEEAVRAAGKWPKSGRRPGHNEMAALLGGKAKLYKPGQAQYERLPEGLAKSVELTAAKNQIRQMGEVGRRSVLADARSAERARLQPLIDQRRVLEEKIRRNAEELAEIEAVGREMIGNRNAAAAQAADLQSQVDLAGRVAASGQGAANDAMNARRAADQEVLNEGLRGVQAGGEIQARNEAVAGATADVARLEQKAEALVEIENTLGKHEAEAVKALTVDRAIKGMKAANTQSKAWSTASRKARVQKIADKVPKKIKANKPTAKMVTKQLDDLKTVLDDAATEGTPESLMTAELLAQATEATVRMNSEVAYQGALRDMMSRTQKANRILKDATATPEAKLKAAQESPAGAVMKMLHDGFGEIEEAVFPEGADYVVKSEMLNMLKGFETAYRGNEWEWLKYWDDATKFFKTWATATPGFHVRNMMSASFMNFSEGVTVGTSSKAMKTWREYANASKVDGGAINFIKKLEKDDPAMARAFEAVFGSGTGGAFEFAELGDELATGAWGRAKNNFWTRKMRQIGVDWTEGPVRLALAKHYIDKGGDVYSAMNAITRVHFDYSQVSSFDKQMKRIIPFWTFMSRNLPLQVEQMWVRPKAYAVYNNFVKNFSDDKEGEGMPSWLQDVGGFTAMRDVPLFGGADVALRPDLPHTRLQQEVGSIFPNPTRLAASANPFLRVPFELGMNHSAFYDGELFREGEGDFMDQLEYTAKNVIPPFATAGRVGLLGGQPAEKNIEKGANLFGAPITAITDEQRRRALQQAAAG